MLNSREFIKQYNAIKYDVDKYFMHLSEATSEEAIYNLTRGMNARDSMPELTLISAKLLLALKELEGVNTQAAKLLDGLSWFSYLYYNQGNLASRF